jgi:hypothetical protein
LALDQQARLVGAVHFGIDEDLGIPAMFSLGVARDRRRQYIGIRLEVLAILHFQENDFDGPVYSYVDKNNDAMNGLNEKLSATTEDHQRMRLCLLPL